MAENKFIQRLKGIETAESVVEIKDSGTRTSFANMPTGTSSLGRGFADPRNDAVVVSKSAENWKVDSDSLVAAPSLYGDGRDLLGTYKATGNSVWVNATYIFDSPKIFSANTKWVLKLCGSNLLSSTANTIGFTLLIKFGADTITTKDFTVAVQANSFCKEFDIDFGATGQSVIKAVDGDALTVQLLCADSNATATIYSGMTTLTALQRRIDASTVASDTATFEDLENAALGVSDVQIDGVSIVEDRVADIPMATYLADYVLKSGDTMSGALSFSNAQGAGGIFGYTNGIVFFRTVGDTRAQLAAMSNEVFMPYETDTMTLGAANHRWKELNVKDAFIGTTYTARINNGYNLAVPQKSGTLATIDDVNDALANAGNSLTNKGVWYAKMYSQTVAPSAEDGTNYADFSQVDGNGDPIIVIYERQSGAWVQVDTITPPANYNGYVIVTSKIWDIPEQTGQQGGQVNWDCVHKTFTPYPKIVSFEDAALTGNSTVQMPVTPTNDSITNKEYVDNAIAASAGTLDLFDWKWKDYIINKTGWALSDGNWDTSATAYQHLVDDFTALGVTAWNAIIVNVGNWWRYSSEDKIGEAHPYAFADEEYNLVYCDTETPAVGVDELYDNYTAEATSLGMLTGGGDYDTVYWPSYETIGETTVAYFSAEDGHKIVLRGYYDEGKNAVDAIYAATGVAWYYVLDTDNQQFVLPRTQFGFVGIRTNPGEYVAPELPNIKAGIPGVLFANNSQTATGAATITNKTNKNLDDTGGTGECRATINIDASLYDSTYQDNGKVQAPATQMYLYFYIGV